MGGVEQRTLRAPGIGRVRRAPLSTIGLLFALLLAGNTHATGPQTSTAKIALEKSAGVVTANGDGTFDVEFWFHLQNIGEEPIKYFQLRDRLSDHIHPAKVVRVSTLVIEGTA